MAEGYPATMSELHRAPDSPTDPSLKNNQVGSVLLHGVSIVSLTMEGKERLCLAQISSTLLKDFSYNEIHNRRVALGITCAQCTPVQLELLRRAGAMPVTSRRCGMITRREAERLCKSFLGDNSPPKLPENFAFDVCHDCAWSCRGAFLPSRYNSSRAKCIKCFYCGLFFSPNKFIFHSHRMPDSSYVQPDAANFNSWRRHIRLSGSPPDNIAYAWEDVKAMFNGGSRKRPSATNPSSHNSTLGSMGRAKDVANREESFLLSSSSESSNPATTSPAFLEPPAEEAESQITTKVSKTPSSRSVVTVTHTMGNVPRMNGLTSSSTTLPPRKKVRIEAPSHGNSHSKSVSNGNPVVSLNPSSIQPVLAMANAAINYGAAIQPYLPRIHPLYHPSPSSATSVTAPVNTPNKPAPYTPSYDTQFIEYMWNNHRLFQQCLNPYAINAYSSLNQPSTAPNPTNAPKGMADFTIAALTRKDATNMTAEFNKNSEWPANWTAWSVNNPQPFLSQRLTDLQIISKFASSTPPATAGQKLTWPVAATVPHNHDVPIQQLDGKKQPATIEEHSSNEEEIIDVEGGEAL